jgi:hypothetical protein
MKTSRVLSLGAGLHLFVGVTLASAGQFLITSVSYGGWLRDTYQLVTVNAEAKYAGELDFSDRAWLIKTFLNDSYGDDLNDWNSPDFSGGGKSGTSITETGMIVTCEGSCAANGSIVRNPCGSGVLVHYMGKAGVAIYHQDSPEIDIKYGQAGDVACIVEPSTNDPPDANYDPGCPKPELCTPIVVDLGGDGFRFTGLDQAVEFDLDADGVLETLGWSEGAGDEAFLALDRNGNGRIDDGTELFGGVTPQPVAGAPDGFKALRVFDEPAQGGTGDGWIAADDAIYPSLRLWLDRNHDGISQPDELSDLATWGVDGIELDVVESRRRDRYGNQLRWASHLVSGGQRGLRTADVIFVAR